MARAPQNRGTGAKRPTGRTRRGARTSATRPKQHGLPEQRATAAPARVERAARVSAPGGGPGRPRKPEPAPDEAKRSAPPANARPTVQVDETTGRESDEAAPVLESAARTVAEETGRIADAPDVAVAEPSGSPIVAGGVPRTRAAAVREDVAEAVATAAATGGAVTTAAVGEQVARFGDPVQRAQERIAGLLQEQVRDTAETTRRLMTCTSLPAAIWLQIDATGRTAGRMVAQGQAVAALGRDMLRAIGPSRRR